MSTNYYLHHRTQRPCPTCGHAEEDEPLHIGFSAVGWVFALRIHPKLGIHGLDDWKDRWGNIDYYIQDEYGRELTAAAMLRCITERGQDGDYDWDDESWKSFHARNHSAPGPRGLLRYRLPGIGCCVAHGEGTWDLFDGDFD